MIMYTSAQCTYLEYFCGQECKARSTDRKTAQHGHEPHLSRRAYCMAPYTKTAHWAEHLQLQHLSLKDFVA